MTTDKARKRAVRTRMEKTGERYAAARRNIVGSDGPPPLPPRVADPGMSDEGIKGGTGREWDAWLRELDRWGAAGRPHGEIARHVHEAYGISGWWAQSVTVGYERARGMRAVNQTVRGFEVSVSRTIPASADEIWHAFVEPARRKRWLESGTLRTRPGAGTVGRSARFDVPADGTRANIWLAPKGEDRTAVTLNHEGLAGPEDVAASRAIWKARLQRLADEMATREPSGAAARRSSGVATRERRAS